MTTGEAAEEAHPARRRRRWPRGAVREGLITAGLELARAGGPDAVVLREATRIVGVVPNAAYGHFANRDELLAAVSATAMDELAARMAAAVAGTHGKREDPASVALRRLQAIGSAYLHFARDEPGLFATAFAGPQQLAFNGQSADAAAEPDDSPLGQLRAALDELVDTGIVDPLRRANLEYPVWAAVHGAAVLAGQGPLRDHPDVGLKQLEALTLSFIGAGITDRVRTTS